MIFASVGNLHIRADGFDFLAAHQNDLIGFRRSFFRIDQFSGFDGE